MIYWLTNFSTLQNQLAVFQNWKILESDSLGHHKRLRTCNLGWYLELFWYSIWLETLVGFAKCTFMFKNLSNGL